MHSLVHEHNPHINWDSLKETMKENVHDVVNGICALQDIIDAIHIYQNFVISKWNFYIHLPTTLMFLCNVFLVVNHFAHHQCAPIIKFNKP